MLNHFANLLALRARALTVSVATTGSITMEATATGFARAAGSFVTDGFAVGMEVVPSGFAVNAPAVVTGVLPLAMTVRGGRAPEAAAGGRSLTVGLPVLRAWENAPAFTPEDGRPFVEEDYLAGPVREPVPGVVEGDPMYVLRLYGPQGVGTMAAYTLSDALLDVFRPRTQISLPSGDVLHVRGNPAPYRGQLTIRNGRSLIVVTIPLRILTDNILP